MRCCQSDTLHICGLRMDSSFTFNPCERNSAEQKKGIFRKCTSESSHRLEEKKESYLRRNESFAPQNQRKVNTRTRQSKSCYNIAANCGSGRSSGGHKLLIHP
ncbi:Hypothetical predicted protein [Octopus vulgaris]|uniref:Uncharacterized protein n=1 Tax=Octopus vulgaris TaxID=6645 RepID=A0AA36BRL2_OCTVU|nr:Hypothetical predicted protein [Octopus vulgaris]